MKSGLTAFVALTISVFSLLFYVPLLVFSNNSDEFSCGYFDMALHLIWPVVIFLILAAILIRILPVPISKYLAVFFTALALALYIQGTFLIWDYGVFDGNDIKWNSYSVQNLTDLFLWLALPILALVFSKRFLKLCPVLLSILATIYLINIASVSSSKQIIWSLPGNPESVKPVYEFSEKSNVILILLDAFASPAFEHIINKSAEFKNFFKDFTYYKNTTGSFPSTYPSVPAIMSGHEYDNSVEIKKFLADKLPAESFPGTFLNNGYRVDLVTIDPICLYVKNTSCRNMRTLTATDRRALEKTELARLLDVSFFRQSPQPLKKLIYANDNWFLQSVFESKGYGTPQMSSQSFPDIFERNAERNADSETLKFYHLALPHLPVRFDEQCERLNKEGQKVDRNTLYLNQAACALRITNRILDKLRKIDAYDNSFIVVLADHGLAVDLPTIINEHGKPHPAFASPLLLIKKPFNKEESRAEITISNAPARLADLSKTLSTYFKFDNNFSGESILELKEDSDRERTYRHYRRLKDLWKSDYLPDMKEYIIKGSPWSNSNWKQIRSLKSPEDK